jgi:hypothetical protein
LSTAKGISYQLLCFGDGLAKLVGRHLAPALNVEILGALLQRIPRQLVRGPGLVDLEQPLVLARGQMLHDLVGHVDRLVQRQHMGSVLERRALRPVDIAAIDDLAHCR